MSIQTTLKESPGLSFPLNFTEKGTEGGGLLLKVMKTDEKRKSHINEAYIIKYHFLWWKAR